MPKRPLCAVALAVLVLAASATVASAAQLELVASIVPVGTFVERIAGDRAEVSVLVPPGASPATYEPKPSQMAALSRADAFFAVGVPFERVWLPRIRSAVSGLDVVDLTRGIERVPMAAEHDHDHDHATGHDHDHDNDHDNRGLDPHIWLAPPLVLTMADTILDALIRLDPDGEAVYRANHAAFAADVRALDQELRATLAHPEGHGRFMVYHPSWGYFARAYGLTQLPVELEGKDPGPRELARLIDEARDAGISVVFVSPQFSERAAREIAASIDGSVAVADPLAADWAANLRRAAAAFAKAAR